MQTDNAYQDIQILKNASFENIITFDSTYTMTENKDYAAIIAKDNARTEFTGPKTTNSGATWSRDTVTEVEFTVDADIASNTIQLTLSGACNRRWSDDFEGVWDLLEYDSSTDKYTRHMQGDVVVSPSVVTIFDDRTAAS